MYNRSATKRFKKLLLFFKKLVVFEYFDDVIKKRQPFLKEIPLFLSFYCPSIKMLNNDSLVLSEIFFKDAVLVITICFCYLGKILVLPKFCKLNIFDRKKFECLMMSEESFKKIIFIFSLILV